MSADNNFKACEDPTEVTSTSVGNSTSRELIELKEAFERTKRELEDAQATNVRLTRALHGASSVEDTDNFFLSVIKLNMEFWGKVMRPAMMEPLEGIEALLSGVSNTKRQDIFTAMVKDVRNGRYGRKITHEVGGAWPIGVERVPFPELNERSQVALIAWLYLNPNHAFFRLFSVHQKLPALQNTLGVYLLFCVDAIKTVHDQIDAENGPYNEPHA